MPAQQQSIRQYLTTNNANENGDVQSMQTLDVVMENMCEQLVMEFKKSTQTVLSEMKTLMEHNLEKVAEIRTEMNERILIAEKTVVETMEEVVRLRSEVFDLKKAMNQRPGQTEDGEVDRDEGEGHEHQQVLPEGVSSEVLVSMAKDHQRVQDNYWRSSLMITTGAAEKGDYRSWMHKLRTCGLHFMVECVRSHYVTGRGNIRLTFASEFEMRKTLIRGRKYCKENLIRNIHIEYMTPPRHVDVKKQMMRYGRLMKMSKRVTSYDVVMRDSEPVLRTFHQSDGVIYWTLGELQQQDTRPRQSPSGDATNAEMMEEYDDDVIIHTDEDGVMYMVLHTDEDGVMYKVFNPERDLPTVANQGQNGSHD